MAGLSIPSWAINIGAFLLGIGAKTVADYVRQDRLQEQQIARERKEAVRDWHAKVRRTLQDIERQYEGTDTDSKDERNEMRDTVREVVDDLCELKDEAPPDVETGTMNRLSSLIEAAEGIGGNEAAVAVAKVGSDRARRRDRRRSNRTPQSNPNPFSASDRSKDDDDEAKGNQRFKEEMQTLMDSLDDLKQKVATDTK